MEREMRETREKAKGRQKKGGKGSHSNPNTPLSNFTPAQGTKSQTHFQQKNTPVEEKQFRRYPIEITKGGRGNNGGKRHHVAVIFPLRDGSAF